LNLTNNKKCAPNTFKIYISATTTEPTTSMTIKFVHEHICWQNFKWSNDICSNNFYHHKFAFEFNSSLFVRLGTISFTATTPEPTTSTMTSLHLNSTRPNHESRHNFIYSNHTRTNNFYHDKFAFYNIWIMAIAIYLFLYIL
jgi:hypothetical protein